VVNAMENHKHAGDVQNRGCFALRSLLDCGQESTSAQAAVEGDCIEHVIAAMKNHASDEDLQCRLHYLVPPFGRARGLSPHDPSSQWCRHSW
jgi:hypothetical protein